MLDVSFYFRSDDVYRITFQTRGGTDVVYTLDRVHNKPLIER
jgi:hypothetical protein